MLRALEFRVGAPTILEFIDRYRTELSNSILAPFSPREIQDRLVHRILMVSKLACCSYELI